MRGVVPRPGWSQTRPGGVNGKSAGLTPGRPPAYTFPPRRTPPDPHRFPIASPPDTAVPARLVPAALRRLYRRAVPHPAPDFAGLWEAACTKWFVGELHVHPDAVLAVTGWAVTPPNYRPYLEFRVNGTPAASATYPLPRPDVAAKLPFAAGALDSGFAVVHPLPDPAADLTLTLADARTGQSLGKDYPPVYVPGPGRAGPLPAGHRIARVIGESSVFNFRAGGFTVFRTLEDAVERAAGQVLADFPRVLDWGCGCARVSRYFLDASGVQLTGADVDPDNVAWCRDHLPNGEWLTLPLRPPTPLPAAGFDMAIGVSVFTHLKEPEQRTWLRELERVVRPGGLALMTFHGPASVVWAGLSAERYAQVRSAGIADQPNPLYDADLGEADYYRDVFHSAAYVRRVWGRHFDILAIEPCAIAHQDLVVMRRR